MLNAAALGVLLSLSCTSIIAKVPDELVELAQQLHKECVGQTGVDESLIKIVNDKQGFPDDEKLKCYVKCLMSEMAVIDDEGTTDIDALVALMPDNMQAKSRVTMTTCGTKKGANACDTVYLTHKCYYEIDSDYFLI